MAASVALGAAGGVGVWVFGGGGVALAADVAALTTVAVAAWDGVVLGLAGGVGAAQAAQSSSALTAARQANV